MLPKSANALVFDFDGVVIDSIPTKTSAFAHVLSNYPKDKVDHLLDFHSKNGGVSRRAKFQHFFEEIVNESKTVSEIVSLEEAFGRYVLDALKSQEFLIEDCIAFINKVSGRIPLFVASAAFESEVKVLCEVHNLSGYFQKIYGHPTKKDNAITEIAKNLNSSPADIILIGDSRSDLKAAENSGASFWGYNNKQLQSLCSVYRERLSDIELV